MNELAKLANRRASNRRSQQKAREAKETELGILRAENERLRSLIAPIAIPFKPVNLDACRQAFLAVLASVCDPHLNTIHAVCAKFVLARRGSHGGSTLHPPRPPNRPLNVDCVHKGDLIDSAYDIDFSDLTPTSMFIPDQNTCGPLYIPGLEPVHPVSGYEIDAGEVWQCVLELVDMSRIDAEELATRISERVRCYGYGPVLTRSEVVNLCQSYPALNLFDAH